MDALTRFDIPGVPVRRGKVREVYDFGDRLLLVATDRVSVFDRVLPTGIPDKGRVLTQLSKHWLETLAEASPHHLISDDPADVPLPAGVDAGPLRGRSMVVRKCRPLAIECVVRGYLAGSGWREYQAGGTVCGVPLPTGLNNASRLPEPIFTPATKAEEGHDENIPYGDAAEIVGEVVAAEARLRSLALYEAGRDASAGAGIVVADTKFEFGVADDGSLLLIDEALTPDSSRFWPAEEAAAGGRADGTNPPSFDKQFVRDWAESTGWDKESPAPEIPADVVDATRAKYVEAYERLAGRPFAWS